MSTLETQYRKFLEANQKLKISFEEWKKVNARLIKQALVNMMKDDEELGLYDEPFKHKVEVIPTEEVLANRSNAYEFIDFDKQETKELNHHIASFLFKNGFEGIGGDSYRNPKCTVIVLDTCYKINYNHPEYGEVSTYTDSWSIPHLAGTLTWNDLIDRNYIK
jgi:hypothetical protein